MGAFSSKKKTRNYNYGRKNVKSLTEEVRLLQKEINQIMHEKEKETREYDRRVMALTFREAEWKGERKKLKEEVKRLRKAVDEKEGKIRELEENYGLVGGKCVSCDKGWPLLGSSGGGGGGCSSILVEKVREERARRNEAVEKWKQLYLAIKTELDDLIQRTHGDALYWRAEEEETVEELRREVRSKEETIEGLQVRLALMEREEYERKREIDILRQSLRILSCSRKKVSNVSKSGLVKYT
ncbi:hypothetical protein SLE2022_154210 [Rubroshorea leprosula]|uniref:Uncharacterized protein n=1 Tax=Rubroshorea leprosula TaxID=152421 RepID=A0AAV5LE20_9ROSI|nr:hypothetical protein SLEP1_g43617 [Rubroshorea leprosula]